MLSLASCIRIALIASGFAGRCLAGDWYVDAVNGNDANTGATPATAWRTITHATLTVPVGNYEVIHVAAGTYDAALGESFPIYFHQKQKLLGAGIGLSIVDAGGVNRAVMRLEAPGYDATQDTAISGFDLRNARYGVELPTSMGFHGPWLTYLDIRGMSDAGIAAFSFRSGPNYWGSASPVVQHVTCTACTIGCLVDSGGIAPPNHAMGWVTLEDSSFSGNSANGIRFSGSYAINTGIVRRCRIESNGAYGWQVIPGGSLGVTQTFEECSITANVLGGVLLAPSGMSTSLTMKSCTVAGSSGAGVRVMSNTAQNNIVLRETLIYGNGDDVDLSGATQVDYCDIGDGDFAGSNGNFAADPLFVAPLAHDYRLGLESPCIDTGDPAAPLDPDCSPSDVGVFPRARPQVYCTAKTNSCGGTPAIGWSGASSATSGTGFFVRATGAKALKPGLLLYGDQGPAAVPFSGGTLCIATPVRRSTVVVDSVGTPGACDGILQINVNGFAHGYFGGSPAPTLLVPGTRFCCQMWGRDTPTQALLSDALEFVVCP